MKKGMSLMVTIVIIIVMSILLGVIMTIGSEYIPMLELNEFAVELLNIQNATDEYFLKNSSYPTVDSTQFDLSNLSVDNKSEFKNETATNNIINFKVLDLEIIGISDNKFGNNKDANDVYVVSEETGLVYYLKGVTYKEKTYYTLNKDLYDQTGITPSVNQSTNNIVKYDVIFELSESNYTQNPVTVNVKIPKDATINSITTTNSKSVSSETVQGLYKVISINESSEDKNGNYSITVNYTYNESTKEVVYDVTNFDNITPTFSKSQTVNENVKTVQITAQDDVSGIKYLKYEVGIIKDITYFGAYGKVIENSKFTVSDLKPYTIYIEDNAGNKLMNTVQEVPLSWRDSIHKIEDGVPIPKGFVASPYDGEKEKNGGLVIYELTKDEIDKGTTELPSEEQYTSWVTRNQYVWVPVEDFSKFKRDNFGLEYALSNTLGVDFWELEIVEYTNTPKSILNSTYISQATLTEAMKMYASIKEYGGFYIGRYEVGVDTKRTMSDDDKFEDNIYTVMGKIPYTCVRWSDNNLEMYRDEGGAVQEVRELYQDSSDVYKVVATLPYSVQWDYVLKWWLQIGAVNDVTSSEAYGNFPNTVIQPSDFNQGARYAEHTSSLGEYLDVDSTTSKSQGEIWCLTTGAFKKAKVKNIYDMAGNVSERVMEGNIDKYRVMRGGRYYDDNTGDNNSLATRYVSTPRAIGETVGFRVALYIK